MTGVTPQRLNSLIFDPIFLDGNGDRGPAGAEQAAAVTTVVETGGVTAPVAKEEEGETKGEPAEVLDASLPPIEG